ncbi:MAG: amidohydrolase family protein [Steroidobacteraceae bacterium]
MNRVDAHQHYWSLQRGDYGWLSPRDGGLYRDFMPADLSDSLADCGICATVLVQAAATEEETRFLFVLARKYPSIAGVVGWVDFEAADVRARIDRLIRDGSGKLKGIRPMVQDISDTQWLARGSLDAAFDSIIANDLAFDALVKPEHLGVLEQRLRRHPRLRAVLDHAGKPDIAGAQFEAWSAQIERLARSTSAYCKLSGLLTQAGRNADIARLEAFVGHVFACFGADRVMWGSDWPVVTLCASYRRWLEISLALVSRHAPGHQEAVFASNALRFYRLNKEVSQHDQCGDHGA